TYKRKTSLSRGNILLRLSSTSDPGTAGPTAGGGGARCCSPGGRGGGWPGIGGAGAPAGGWCGGGGGAGTTWGVLEACSTRTPKRIMGWASAATLPTRHAPSQSTRANIGPNRVFRRLRALCSLDITVPIGQPSTSAISRYERPSTSLSMIIVR